MKPISKDQRRLFTQNPRRARRRDPRFSPSSPTSSAALGSDASVTCRTSARMGAGDGGSPSVQVLASGVAGGRRFASAVNPQYNLRDLTRRRCVKAGVCTDPVCWAVEVSDSVEGRMRLTSHFLRCVVLAVALVGWPRFHTRPPGSRRLGPAVERSEGPSTASHRSSRP